jgi:dienelactone hydrolase
MSAASAYNIDFSNPCTLTDETTGISHPVIKAGKGPAVVLMHEITGMTPQFLYLANRIMEAGYTVYMPHLFGPIDKRDEAAGIVFACVRRDFHVFCTDRDSPISSWLHLLCEKAHSECGGPGVGVIGLCLTGNIVMSAMVHPAVRLGVMCEPALPFTDRASLGVSQDTVDRAKVRAQVYPMLAYRFCTDHKCTHEKFKTLKSAFGEGIRLTEIETGVEPWLIPNKSHSVLTGDYVGQMDPNHPVQHALDDILAELRIRLYSPSNAIILGPTHADTCA